MVSEKEQESTVQTRDAEKETPKRKVTSNLSILVHILAVSIGPTVFIFPHAFNMIGYVSAVICTLCVGLFYTFNVHLLLKSSSIICERRGLTSLSFAQLVRYSFEDCSLKIHHFAPYAYNTINILMVISWSGELCFNVVFMCNNLNAIIDQYVPHGIDIHWIIIYSLVPCVLISSIPGLKLSFLGAAATTIDIIFLWVVIFESYYTYDSFQVIPRESVKNLLKIPLFLSTVFFTLNFTGIILPLRNEAEDKNKFDSKFGTFSISVMIICTINALFGFVGYLRYGDFAKYMVTLNLPQDNLLIQIMVGVYCLGIYFCYPILFFVIFEIVWKEWIRDAIKNTGKIYFYEFLTRLGINFVIYFCILCLPKLNWFINIGGLICAVCDSIIVPALVQILVFYGEEEKKYKFIAIRNMVIILSGFVLFYFELQACLHDLTETTR